LGGDKIDKKATLEKKITLTLENEVEIRNPFATIIKPGKYFTCCSNR
jgi:hypothetical protein